MFLLSPQLPEAQHLDPVAYVRLHRAADEALSARRPAEARQAFEGCLELSSENATAAYGLACAEALAGNGDAALDWLERATDWGYADAALAAWDEDLTSLRERSRFAEVLERMRELSAARDPRDLHWIRDEAEVPYVTDAAIDSTGELIAVGQSDGVILVLDARSGRRLGSSASLGTGIRALDFQPGTRMVAALNDARQVHLWTIDPPAPDLGDPPHGIGELASERIGLFGSLLQFDPTGERLLAFASGPTQLFRANGELIRAWHSPASFFRPSLVWSADGGEIASWSGSSVEFRDGRTGLESGRPLAAFSEVASVVYQPGGSLIATGHGDTRVRFWNRDSLELLHEPEIHFTPESWVTEHDLPLSVKWTAFSGDGRYLAASTAELVVLLIFEASSGELLFVHNLGTGRSGEPMAISWGLDSRRVWLAYVSACMPIEGHGTGGEHECRYLPPGQLPTVCPTGAGVIASGFWHVSGLDATRGALLWHRPTLGGEREIIQAPAGYFDCDSIDVEGLLVQRVRWPDDSRLLSGVADELFDPKRVRAARAGVELAPVDL